MRRETLVLIGSGVCVWFPGAVTFGLIGLLVPVWARAFNVGRGPLGLVMTFLLASLGVFMFLGGKYSDRYGARRVVTVGITMCSASLLLFAYSPSVYALYVIAFIWGAGTCLVYIPSLSSAQKWFPRRRGMASGVVNMLFGISAAFMVPVFRYWLDHLGYPLTMVTTAVINALVSLMFARFVVFPEEFETVKPVVGQSGGGVAYHGLSEAIRTTSFWLVWLTWALCGGAGIGMVVHSTSISLSLGLSVAIAATALAIFNLTNGLSRILSGILSDRVGRVTVMSLAYAMGAVGFLLLTIAGGNYPLVALSNLLTGFAFGTLFAVSAPFIMDCFGTRHYGEVFGFTFTAYGFVGSWLGPYVGGLLYDVTGSYFATCLLFSAYCLASAVLVLFAKRPLNG